MTDQVNHTRERIWTLNPWASIAVCCALVTISLLVGFLVHSNLKYQQFRELASHIRVGCANPENHYATVIIDLSEDMSWSCTPMDRPDILSRKHRRALKKRGG